MAGDFGIPPTAASPVHSPLSHHIEVLIVQRPDPLVPAPTQRPRRAVVAVTVREGRLLVIRRSQLVRAPGMYCFPGGGIEEGESETAALERELLEELAVTVEPVRRLWQSTTRWGVQLAWWLAKLPADAQLRPHPAEVESAHWLTPEELRNHPQVLPSNLEFLEALQIGKFELD